MDENLADNNQTCTFDANGAIAGFKDGTPIAVGVFGTGFVFGILAQQAGLNLLEASLMSALVLSGAAQFVVIESWSTPLPTTTIVFTTLIVNVQYVLMGAVLQPWFADLTKTEAYASIFFMTTSNWPLAITKLRTEASNGAFLLGSGIALFGAWVSATVVGGMAGTSIHDPARWGLDFTFVALLVTLLVELYDKDSNLLPLIVAGGTAIMMSWIVPSTWHIIIGGVTGSTVEVIRRAD